MVKMVELHLVNGKKVLVGIDLEKIYDVEERTRKVLSFKKQFPFVSFASVPYVHFRMKTHYEYLKSCLDGTYNVDCDLAAFCKLVDLNFSSFSEAKLRSAIEGQA